MKFDDLRQYHVLFVIGAGIIVVAVAAYFFSGLTIYSGVAEVRMGDNGFAPTVLYVTKGTRIRFFNDGSFWHWPASDPHPLHGAYPAFDPMRGIAPHEAWVFIFDTAGEWGMHDHLYPSFRGKVIVVE